MAETSICLNYSVCAASKLKHEKRLASNWKEGMSSQLLFIRQKTAKSESTECPAGILQIQTQTRSPGGPRETLSLMGAQRGPGAPYYAYHVQTQFWEEHLL